MFDGLVRDAARNFTFEIAWFCAAPDSNHQSIAGKRRRINPLALTDWALLSSLRSGNCR
jgi:hypothetical protein